MFVIYTKKFKKSLNSILDFIEVDNIVASKNFAINLENELSNLVIFPKMYRESLYYQNNNYRDLTYKGYTIIYKINATTIEIIDIFNQNKL